jgi:predicted phosphodiesterase
MRFAILSDIHGNLEALRAVAEDIDRSNVDEIICLGDSIGYGPNPAECLDWVREHCYALLGNAEEAVLFHPSSGGEADSPVVAWTRLALGMALESPRPPLSRHPNPTEPFAMVGDDGEMGHTGPEGYRHGRERRDYLESLPRVGWRADALLVHASPRNPLHEYLLPGCVDAAAAFETLFHLFPRWAFVGHTHLPGVFTEDRRFVSAAASPVFTLTGQRALVNVGSVGQSRDGDPRACYVLWEEDRVAFQRLEYDLAAFLAKTRLHPELASPQTMRWFPAAT